MPQRQTLRCQASYLDNYSANQIERCSLETWTYSPPISLIWTLVDPTASVDGGRRGWPAPCLCGLKMGQASSSSHSTHQHGWVLLKGGSRSSAILGGMLPVDQLLMCVCVCMWHSGSPVGDAWINNNPLMFPIMQPLVLSFITKLWNLHAVNPAHRFVEPVCLWHENVFQHFHNAGDWYMSRRHE